ncbi:hypothetical protein A3860_14800 [Niastella vici]|uniref:Uncharacterized protein n=1 Tax=Niastella vici TaxID=1703345 RepID=A0A1V9G5L3_9BACT|nr:hypothetical protein [Niastella vici]OQP65860.1 hypothetical protein A3860_14800 [Niastella vici]
MDLSVLHPVKSPDRDYSWKDKLNNITGLLGCRFLEWSGWYNQDISQRLLGHYRLYQLFKAKSRHDSLIALPLAYITHYRTLHAIKYIFSCITAVLYYVFTLGDWYYPLLVEQLNKQLINRHHTILQDFLIDVEIDFKKALHNAIDQINGSGNMPAPEITIVQCRLENKVYNNTCHYFTEYNGTVLSGTNELKGKQKGVFTKRQILILFDLLAEKGNLEKIDYTKPNKFESVAELFHAVNGKTKDTWVEEINNFKDKGLYHYGDKGELRQLLITLTNLAETARQSGFRLLAKAVDKKIRELEIGQK